MARIGNTYQLPMGAISESVSRVPFPRGMTFSGSSPAMHEMTPDDWRDYEADRLMARALESRKELEKTHSFTKLVEMQRDWDRRVSTASTQESSDD